MNISKIFVLLILCSCPFLATAQNQVEPLKKIYSSSAGKLYIPKSLSVYLMVSTDSTGKNCTFLKSENASSYTNPMYFASEGVNIFHSPWAVDKKTRTLKLPKQEVTFEVYADGQPPTTHFIFWSLKSDKSDKIFISGKAEITLKAKDELSGVEKTFYSIDSSEYQEYTSSFVLDKEKEYLLKFYSYDHVGNLEAAKSLKIVVDRTTPKTSFEVKGTNLENIFSGNTVVVLNTNDNSSGISKLIVTLDGKRLLNFSGTINTSFLSQGEHKLEYYSEDNVGNREDSNAYTFYVDRTPPTLLQEIMGKTFMSNGKEYSSGRSQLRLTAIDNKAGVKGIYYSINSGDFKQYEKPVILSTISGKISVKAYAVDKVNNQSQASEEANAEQLPFIDLTGPNLAYRFAGPVFIALDTIYISHKTKIHLTAYDNEAGMNNIQYFIDGKESIIYNGPFSIDREGLHTIEYIGTDNVENTTNQHFKVMIDTIGPIIYPRFSIQSKGSIAVQDKTIEIYPSHVGLFIAATDAESGYDYMTYSINGAKEKSFTGYLINFPQKSRITIKAYDKVGNVTTTEVEFETRK